MPTSKIEKERKPFHYANVGKQMEGRHVGLDFYDLLIQALIDRIVSGVACFSSVAQSVRGNEPAQEMSWLLKV